MSTQTLPDSDERIFAALAHGSVLFSFLGPVGPIIVWLTQRGKSRYASFHAMQAMGIQVLSFWLWMLLGAILPLFLMIFLLIGIFAFGDTSNFEYFPIAFQGIIFFVIFGVWGLYFLSGLIGAGFSIAGKDFRYPLLGKWLERYLRNNEEDPFDEERENSWIAAICHATAAIFLWGITVPAIVWISQKSRSIRLSFQAAQATVYQTIAAIAYFIGTVFYMLLFFGLITALFIGGISMPDTQTELPAGIGIIFMIFMILMGIFWLVAMIAFPIYFIISGIASFRTLGGHEYRYPFLGRIVSRYVNYEINPMQKNSEG